MTSVMITGASTGIGRATAEYFAAKGWTVFAGVRKTEDGDALKTAQPSITPVIIDVTKDDEIQKAALFTQLNLVSLRPNSQIIKNLKCGTAELC